ncbi:hypothetical protein HK099_007971 [Clydaea vesicula]|uniref:Superoxide dismutase [Cu-Zn] n=1 Tax=Clydaea vesicula TaxID=447962 RepID=A0AAD5TVU8_9FUNG|nr:hypothetical protein HK099_007971 [Clydaea vesicula]KAJ3384232.1 hypothetical protein HDU92_003708 [Lobulomyces angularis]
MVYLKTVTLTLLSLSSVLSSYCPIERRQAQAVIVPDVNSTSVVKGVINFTQERNRKTKIVLELEGLEPNSVHGWHIHANLIEGEGEKLNCTLAAGHFNPHNLAHGAPESEIRHVGDLGNFVAGEDGKASLQVTDNLVSLFDDASNVFKRGLVIHKVADDFVTQPTGNAGARLACGNIFQN